MKEFLFEHARFPLARLGDGVPYSTCILARGQVDDDADTMIPDRCASAGRDQRRSSTGGAGKHSCWQPTFGDQTWPARRAIARADGAPLKSVAELVRR